MMRFEGKREDEGEGVTVCYVRLHGVRITADAVREIWSEAREDVG